VVTNGQIDLHGNATIFYPNNALSLTDQNLYKLEYHPSSYIFPPFIAGANSVVVQSGETHNLLTGSYASIKVESGWLLVWPDGEIYVGELQLESGANVSKPYTGGTTVLHLNGRCIWRSMYIETDLKQVAQHFVLVQHAANALNMEGRWAGTILAPRSWVTLAQADKLLWGRVLGYNIELHQNATLKPVNLIYTGTPLLEGLYD
jgi:hypothetical protein